VRTFQNIFLRLKVLLLISAGLNVWVFHWTMYRKVAEWDLHHIPQRRAKVAATLSLAVQGGIVIAGRMIVYNWFDCDKPQRPINILAEGHRPDSQ